ncbi:uncharacterized [Tachysurus ichikawai]
MSGVNPLTQDSPFTSTPLCHKGRRLINSDLQIYPKADLQFNTQAKIGEIIQHLDNYPQLGTPDARSLPTHRGDWCPDLRRKSKSQLRNMGSCQAAPLQHRPSG